RRHLDSYVEVLTMAATPAVSNGRPTGTEAIGSLQTLARQYVNDQGQVYRTDSYFKLAGLTYATAAFLGSQGTNYTSPYTGYDAKGRLVRTTTAKGTIQRTGYDGLDRVVSQWIGTSDHPTLGDWSPDNNTAPANMVMVASYEYDGGNVGDGDITRIIQPAGGSAPTRVTQIYYDWRDRPVAGKAGVQASENDNTHRPLVYVDYDNLDEVTALSQYDGDGVTVTTTNGVPDRPSESLLRAYRATYYDDQGRVYV